MNRGIIVRQLFSALLAVLLLTGCASTPSGQLAVAAAPVATTVGYAAPSGVTASGVTASGGSMAVNTATATATVSAAGATRWPLHLLRYSGVIVELVDGRTPKPLSYDRWRDVYGLKHPAAADTDYVKYPWSASVYAVTFWPGGESAWQWDRLTFEQWNRAGAPAPRIAGWIAGSTVYQWKGHSELFLEGEDGVKHQLTYPEWAATGFRAFEIRGGESPAPAPEPAPAPAPPTAPAPIQAPAPGAAADPGLFFDRSTRTSPKKVFAHYFGPYPRSINNAPTRAQDVYSTTYASITHSSWAEHGGLHSDRPLFRPPLSGDWRYQDAVFDIRTAQAHGIDGFVVDMLGLEGSNYDAYARLARAASDLGTGFLVVPMVDKNGVTGQAPPAVAADAIATFAGLESSFYLPDGRFVVTSFKGEGDNTAADVRWWADVAQALRTRHGLSPALLLSFLDFTAAEKFAGLTMGEGSWRAGGDPLTISTSTDQAARSHARGKVYLAPVGGQQVRRRSGLYDEAANTAATRASWEKAIAEESDYIQMVTWSDYSEGTSYAPGEARGYGPLIVAAYYIEKFHTGSYPRILRDEVILSHRSNLVGSGYSGARQQREMQHWWRGAPRTDPRDTVEALTFLTAPADVTVTIAGRSTTYRAPAGMHARTFPLVVGAPPAVSVERDGAVTAQVRSVIPVVNVPLRDDKQYFWFSAIRGTEGQRDPAAP